MAVKNKKTGSTKSTQRYLPFSEIRDNVVVMKDGGIRAVLRTSSINFNLKSEEEQESTIYSYQSFLNALDFPVQITIRSKKLDLDNYFHRLDTVLDNEDNPAIAHQLEEYQDYLQKLVEYTNIMQKEFYVIVPADPHRKESKGVFYEFMDNLKADDSLEKVQRRFSEYKSLFSTLQKRIDLVAGGLEGCGLRVSQLSNQELIDLYYQLFNPALAQYEKLQKMENYNITG